MCLTDDWGPRWMMTYLHTATMPAWASSHRGCTWRKKHFPHNNLPPKMAAAFQGLITNAGLMAAGMSYSYSSQKQTTSLYLYIWCHWNGGESRFYFGFRVKQLKQRFSCVSQFKIYMWKSVVVVNEQTNSTVINASYCTSFLAIHITVIYQDVAIYTSHSATSRRPQPTTVCTSSISWLWWALYSKHSKF